MHINLYTFVLEINALKHMVNAAKMHYYANTFSYMDKVL